MSELQKKAENLTVSVRNLFYEDEPFFTNEKGVKFHKCTSASLLSKASKADSVPMMMDATAVKEGRHYVVVRDGEIIYGTQSYESLGSFLDCLPPMGDESDG